MPASAAAPATKTRRRLLEAAARVFARDGLTGATTRAIAEEARVNEVTLFRHFKTKDRLLAAVVGENFGEKPAVRAVIPPATADLRSDLLALARAYEDLLGANWPLFRAMLGEMHHHLTETHERQVCRAMLQPLKEALLQRIGHAQQAGQLRRDARADVLADLLFGAVFTGVLRRSLGPVKIDYSPAAYVEAVVTMFLEGAAARR